jgi:hypothetical protein
VLPFYEGDDQDPNVIMNIVPELAMAFDTKKRAPFRIVMETVKLSEIKMIASEEYDTPFGLSAERTEEEIKEQDETQLKVTNEDCEEGENPFAMNTFRDDSAPRN